MLGVELMLGDPLRHLAHLRLHFGSFWEYYVATIESWEY